MTSLQSCPGIVPERFFEMLKSLYLIRHFRTAAPAPEAGALPGCATLRWLETRYHIGILDAQALFRANKSEQNEHEAESVLMMRNHSDAFIRVWPETRMQMTVSPMRSP